MKRDIEWVEKLDDGVKRKVRVKFPSGSKLTWQFKRSDEELWDYDSPPSPEDWNALEEKIEGLYNRRRAPYRDVELVKAMKKKALSS